MVIVLRPTAENRLASAGDWRACRRQIVHYRPATCEAIPWQLARRPPGRWRAIAHPRRDSPRKHLPPPTDPPAPQTHAGTVLADSSISSRFRCIRLDRTPGTFCRLAKTAPIGLWSNDELTQPSELGSRSGEKPCKPQHLNSMLPKFLSPGEIMRRLLAFFCA